MTVERMRLVDCLLELARSQRDVRESGGPNAGIPSTRYMGERREPWCAWWIAWLYREAGAPLPGDLGVPDGRASPLAGVEHLEAVFESSGWLVRAPMRGDLAFFAGRDGSDHGPGRHVGLVERATLHELTVWSGNFGDAVARTVYRRAALEGRVSAYGRRPEPEGWAAPPPR